MSNFKYNRNYVNHILLDGEVDNLEEYIALLDELDLQEDTGVTDRLGVRSATPEEKELLKQSLI